MLFPIFVLSARRRDQQHVSPYLRLYHEPHLTPPSPVYAPPLVYIPKQLSFRSKLLLNQERADTKEKQQQGSSRLLNREADDDRILALCWFRLRFSVLFVHGRQSEPCRLHLCAYVDCSQPVRANAC
jgi:hypothetical protein